MKILKRQMWDWKQSIQSIRKTHKVEENLISFFFQPIFRTLIIISSKGPLY